MKAILNLEFDNIHELIETVTRLGVKTSTVISGTATVAPKPIVTDTTVAPKPVAAAPVAPKPVAAAPVAPKPVVVPEKDELLVGEEEEETISYETLWANVSAKIQAGHREPIKAELGRLGAGKVSELKPDQFNAFNKFVLELA